MRADAPNSISPTCPKKMVSVILIKLLDKDAHHYGKVNEPNMLICSSLFNLIGCDKSYCTRWHDASNDNEFGIMAKQETTNLIICPLRNNHD